MFRIVFWNVFGKGPRSGIVPLTAGLVTDHAPDLLALAECEPATAAAVLKRLNPRGRAANYDLIPDTTRVRMFLRGRAQNATLVAPARFAHERFHIVRLDRGPGNLPLVLAAAHMVSLLEKHPLDIDQQLRHFSFEIEEAERHTGVGHQNTIAFGDFNAHPFSPGVAQHGGLHAVLSRGVAERGTRRVVFNTRPMFFNPMWRFYGNPHPEPVGTYYREGSGDELAYFWHMFDQFLIRPALLPFYRPDSASILTTSGGTPLLADHVPDKDRASDHLPVMLTLHC